VKQEPVIEREGNMSITVRHIKKYTNRKFYDLDRGRYVSLLDIGGIVAGGEEIEVHSDRTGRDLTFEVLVRALYERTMSYSEASLKGTGHLEEPAPRSSVIRLIRLVPDSPKPESRRKAILRG
jgi:hypothetical protein